MRVITGEYKGRKLVCPSGDEVRPTSDKVKEAIFSMIAERVVGASCLDLFAGTGALGIEALSRGAKGCLFCESSPAAYAALTENLRFAERARSYKTDFRALLRRLRSGEKADIVFVDPPYQAGYYSEVMKMLLDYDIINTGGLAVLERHAGEPQDYTGFLPLRIRKYGKTQVEIYEKTTL
ncbi:MAG: 16S rRNA (guanine(966)-N(2))-methyltransferase RsmD [Clostridiales Family XIII bacterium]|jgi:16S rRNA (guanine(966)-N(2))-methyltransferase RsmD|nr:16S rRNA (guanine(966)-N(2))-methyltransferase RsmD [Clostridiales Family XIII bacterium]